MEVLPGILSLRHRLTGFPVLGTSIIQMYSFSTEAGGCKAEIIFRIEFINDSTGYVCGSNSYAVTLFPNVSLRATSATVCTPLATFLTSGSNAAGLL